MVCIPLPIWKKTILQKQIDYKKQALEKAKLYQEQQAMSKNAIFQQLTSDFGEKFTEEEAQYAINNLDK